MKYLYQFGASSECDVVKGDGWWTHYHLDVSMHAFSTQTLAFALQNYAQNVRAEV